jgi:hypothetical protein
MRAAVLHQAPLRVRIRQRVTVFRPDKGNVGLLDRPGKKPRIEYGLMTDIDLLQVANEYVGTAAK